MEKRKNHETEGKQEKEQKQNNIPKEKKRLHPLVQILLYLLLTFSISITTISAVVTNFMLQNEIFLGETDVFLNQQKEVLIENNAKKLLYIYLSSGMPAVDSYCRNTNIRYAIYPVKSGRRLGANMTPATEKSATVLTFDMYSAGLFYLPGMENYRIKIYLDDPGEKINEVEVFYRLMEFFAQYRYQVLGVLIAGMAVSVFLFTVLIRSACRPSSRKVSFLYKIPMELLLGAVAGIVYYIDRRLMKTISFTAFNVPNFTLWIHLVLFVLAGSLTLLHIVPRVRREDWYKGTCCYLVFFVVGKFLSLCRELYQNLSMIWRALVVFVVVSVLQFGVMRVVLLPGEKTNLLMRLFVAEKIIIVPLLLYLVLIFQKLHLAAKELASGNLKYKMNVKYMPGIFKDFSRDMNAVADSVSLAVEERMKSEHLKTELITNVSHDIKTPLTSIINFSDLITKEKSENPKITEYAEHLYKQSSRLKKLIEDLMEVSKAATGNLEVNPENCDVRVLLGQCMGEYEQRLAQRDIDLIVKPCPEPLWVMADTRLLWRIFDNLMTNIVKYAQSNTRVYLSVEQMDERIFISFKNISKYPLDVSADSLMERFVRGDLSRHTEGNGLGLSIVKSLMDLQGAELELVVDGDLFKAILKFPAVQPIPESAHEECPLPSGDK